MLSKLGLAGASVGVLLLLIVGFYAVSVMWWSVWISLVAHWVGGADWSWWWTVTHWGLISPFVLG